MMMMINDDDDNVLGCTFGIHLLASRPCLTLVCVFFTEFMGVFFFFAMLSSHVLFRLPPLSSLSLVAYPPSLPHTQPTPPHPLPLPLQSIRSIRCAISEVT